MVTNYEAKSLAISIYLQAATLSGLEVSRNLPTALSIIIDQAYPKVSKNKRPEAIANMLKLFAASLDDAKNKGKDKLDVNSLKIAQNKICPVFPFDD